MAHMWPISSVRYMCRCTMVSILSPLKALVESGALDLSDKTNLLSRTLVHEVHTPTQSLTIVCWRFEPFVACYFPMLSFVLTKDHKKEEVKVKVFFNQSRLAK